MHTATRFFLDNGGTILPEPVAAYSDSVTLYWHGIIFSAAIMTALLIFFSLARQQDSPGGRSRARSSAYLYPAAIISVPLGVLGARILYCIFTPDAGGIFDLTGGGYALYGAAAGVLGALAIASAIWKKPYPELLDAASPAAAAGIAIGRMAAFFSHEELGYIIKNEKYQYFPVSVYVESEGLYRLCVFSFEALAAVIAFIACVWLFDRAYVSKKQTGAHKGDVFIMLAIIYCCSQTLLESWRTDTMTMRNNGFVRISQVLSAVLLAAALAVVFARACTAKKKTVTIKDAAVWTVTLGLFAIAFIMEFGKHKETMLRNNWVMFFTLFPISVIGIAALLGAFRFEAPEPRETGSGTVSSPRRGSGFDVKNSVKAGTAAKGYKEPAFDDDDEW